MRHSKTPKRLVEPDKIYNNLLVARFINRTMYDGKKSVAQDVVYGAFDVLKAKGNDPIETFEKAIQNVSPKLEVKARRVGGASYQIPSEVRPERRLSLAIRWIIEASRKRSNKEYHTFAEKLASELLDATQNLGEAVRKRDVMQKQAEANRAFASFKY
jgi:small subunit ribosomal protein S7